MATDAELTPTEFDYKPLGDAAGPVQGIAKSIKGKMLKAAESIIDIGIDLLDAKKFLKHGKFIPWLRLEFDMSERTAQNYMNVAKRFGSENRKSCGFAPGVLYALSSPDVPDEAIDEAIAVAATGQKVDSAKADEIIADCEGKQMASDLHALDVESEVSECQIETPNDEPDDLPNDREEREGQAAGHEVAAREEPRHDTTDDEADFIEWRDRVLNKHDMTPDRIRFSELAVMMIRQVRKLEGRQAN